MFCFLRFPSGLSRPPPSLVARPAQGAAVHGRRLAPDGDLRRHGARGQGHDLRQGLRRGRPRLRRVHNPQRRDRLARDPERRAAARRVRALRRVRRSRGAGRGPTGRAGCAWSACWSGCRSRSTPPRGEGRHVSPEISAGAFVSAAPGSPTTSTSAPGRSSTRASRSAPGAWSNRAPCSASARGCAPARAPPGYELGPLVIEEGVTVCCGAVVYAGSRIGAGAIIGDQAQVRERSTIGAGSVVGRGSAVDFDAHVGERVLIQTGVYVTGGSVVEDDVFLGPGVLTTNDNTMGRHRPGRARGPGVPAGVPGRRRGRAGARSRDRRGGVRRRRRGRDAATSPRARW